MGKRKWKFKNLLRSMYGRQIWRVANRRGTRGYFKFPVSKDRKELRFLVANEYIAASLARSVGLPVAKVKEISVKGPKGMKRRGIVSIRAKAKKVIPWKKAREEVHMQPGKHVKQTDLLGQVMVFDAWILNPDRTNHNLILYRNKPAARYKWYLIDHGIALFGKPSKWSLRKAKKSFVCKRSFKFSLHSKKKKRIRVPKGLKRFISANRQVAERMISKIESLPRSDINKAIKRVPKGYLKKSEKKFIKKMLLCRQKQMKEIVHGAVESFHSNTS